jgi:hypothetical protein
MVFSKNIKEHTLWLFEEEIISEDVTLIEKSIGIGWWWSISWKKSIHSKYSDIICKICEIRAGKVQMNV